MLESESGWQRGQGWAQERGGDDVEGDVGDIGSISGCARERCNINDKLFWVGEVGLTHKAEYGWMVRATVVCIRRPMQVPGVDRRSNLLHERVEMVDRRIHARPPQIEHLDCRFERRNASPSVDPGLDQMLSDVLLHPRGEMTKTRIGVGRIPPPVIPVLRHEILTWSPWIGNVCRTRLGEIGFVVARPA